MSEPVGLDEKFYAVSDTKRVSMRELLHSFERHGTSRVTDLHLKVGLPPVYRVDGELKITNGRPLDEPTLTALVRTLMNDAEWETLCSARSVNNSHLIGNHRFRVNCYHDRKGLALAIRALDTSTPTIDMIGFPNRVWEDIVGLQQGLVLVTGATGVGKSTTIAALLNHIAQTRACHIITLEDPIEYQIESSKAIISQRAVGRDVPGYERGLRDCLREDPDVIFVGEMTDQESTTWTLTAAETGHLVFSGLHTRDTASTINRILDLYPAIRAGEVANQFSMALRYIISQKLVPRAGERGRVAAMEILNNTYAVANLIRQVKPEQIATLIQTQTRDVPEQRMSTLEHSLAVLVRQGRITRDDALKSANHPQLLIDELQRDDDAGR
ncbi:MAG: PilT/PilU family type 4a pilus ATPase [Phycisphaerae bacterium]|jgi:twitching motility protein PilT